MFTRVLLGQPALYPHTLIGIRASGDWDDIAGRAGIVLAGVEVPDPPVDFVRIGGGGLEDYLRKRKPFHRRKTFGLFRYRV